MNENIILLVIGGIFALLVFFLLMTMGFLGSSVIRQSPKTHRFSKSQIRKDLQKIEAEKEKEIKRLKELSKESLESTANDQKLKTKVARVYKEIFRKLKIN